jgi:hypothetical protein
MTLAELLSAQLVAAVVLAAAGTLVVLSLNSEQRVADKVEGMNQGRVISAQIEQRLNSSICLYPGEYKVNGATVAVAASSILHAGDNAMVYFADISGKGPSTDVGFQPNLRYLLAPTAGGGRTAGFIDAYRAAQLPTGATYASIPFNFNLGSGTLEDLAAANGPNSIQPTSVLRRVGLGITNAVTGSVSTAVPFFQYWAGGKVGPTDTPIATVNGVIPAAQLDTIGKIRVTYRVLGQSGRNGRQNGAGTTLDDRSNTFSTDIYLRTAPNICGKMRD